MIYYKNKIISNLVTKAFIWLLLLLPLSCIDRLDFIGETKEGDLVIYGVFTDVNETQVVKVSRTSLFGLAPRGVPNAEVNLVSESGQRYTYRSIGNGDYELYGVQGEPGMSYAIEVQLDGNSYRSSYETMPETVGQDDLSFVFQNEPFRNESLEPVFTLFNTSRFPNSSEPVFLRWQVEETYLWIRTWLPCVGLCPPPPPNCFISDLMEPDRINLFESSGTATATSSFVLGKRSVDNSFISIFYITVKQFSISSEAYNYWERLKISISNQGSLFDIPPAPVFGNISNSENPSERILGYFEVAKTNITRIRVTAADVPFFLSRPCEYIVGKPAADYAGECVNCEERAKGKRWTNTEPVWWNKD